MAIDMATLKLRSGGHSKRSDGVCLLEAVAWFAGKPHTDHPPCVSGVLGAFGRAFNDAIPDDARQRLIPYIPQLVGTATDDIALECRRAFMAADAAVRIFASLAFRAAGLGAEADKLAALSEVVDEATARSARSAAWSAESAAWSAWSAESAESAAGSAAWSAWSAARSAAESAASAAESAAGSAAWSAWSAARSAAIDQGFALLDRLIAA